MTLVFLPPFRFLLEALDDLLAHSHGAGDGHRGRRFHFHIFIWPDGFYRDPPFLRGASADYGVKSSESIFRGGASTWTDKRITSWNVVFDFLSLVINDFSDALTHSNYLFDRSNTS